MAKKRVLSFQTPRKKTATPMRTGKKPEQPIAQKETETSETLENKLIEAYRKENSLLRALKCDALLYSKLLGITITESQDKIFFTIERDSSTGQRKLAFTLQEGEKSDSYIFTLQNYVNCNIPDFFYDIIEFKKKEFPLMFFKTMQAVYETRVNE